MPWTDKVTNGEVLRRAGVRRELMTNIEKRQLQFLHYVLRVRRLERVCLPGRINGKRAKGRQRLKHIDSSTVRMDRIVPNSRLS